MDSLLDFTKVCRACLSDNVPMSDLFDVCTADIFKFCTSVEITDDDQLPKQICQNCMELLNKIYYFKQVVIRSNTVLRQQCCLEDIKAEAPTAELEVNPLPDIAFVDENEDSIQKTIQDHPDIENEPEAKPRKRRKCARAVSIKPKSKGARMKCVKCEKSFQKYETLEAHMRSHFGKKPDIKCSQCDKSFLTFRSLQAHSRTHGGARRYQCQTCGKNFAYHNVLKNHEMIHAGIKRHACHICDMKFVQAYNLKMHLETHSAQKNYGCTQCGKKFAQPGNLKIHLIRHTGVKNISCTVCDMKFYVKSDLYKHMRSHSETKPFGCHLCPKKFKSKSFQTVHMRTHTGDRPYVCDFCPKRFMARKDLRNHRMIHTGEKPHKCQLCNQAFIQKCALNRHMKGHNKTVTDETMNSVRQVPPQVRVPDEVMNVRQLQGGQVRVLHVPPNMRHQILQETPMTISYEWQGDA